jgi:hypothetical protein
MEAAPTMAILDPITLHTKWLVLAQAFMPIAYAPNPDAIARLDKVCPVAQKVTA